MTSERPDTEHFDAWARRRGLSIEHTSDGARALGKYRDLATEVDLDVEEFRELGEQGRVAITRTEKVLIRMKPRADVQDLQVSPEGITAKMAKLFGGQDIQMNDAEFDPLFLIRGSKPGVEKVLGVAARAALLHARERDIEVCIGEGVVFFKGVPPKDDAHFDTVLEAVAQVAVALGG